MALLAPLFLNGKDRSSDADAEAVMRELVPLPPAVNRRGERLHLTLEIRIER